MRSVGTSGATALTIVTLVFAPVLNHGHWLDKLVGHYQTTVQVQCVAGKNCPKRAHVTESATSADATEASIDAATALSITQGVADFQSPLGADPPGQVRQGDDAAGSGHDDQGGGHGSQGHGKG